MPPPSLGLTPVPAAPGFNCQIEFGAGASSQFITGGSPPALHVGLPVLGGARGECLLAEADTTSQREGFVLFARGQMLAGFALANTSLALEEGTAELYQRLFTVCADRHLYRVWNYIPAINAIADGMENYRCFCRGRSLAFEQRFGASFRQILPAASAVGTAGGPLALAFLAGATAPTHFENPRQVPAFDYPQQYGPRSPSFSRATTIPHPFGRQVLVAGTAAIIGHASVAAGDLDGQLRFTLENLRVVGAIAGAGESLGFAQSWSRRFKVYLRHATDLARVRHYLNRSFLQPGDEVQYLQADICRSDLLVEIEAILTPTTG